MSDNPYNCGSRPTDHGLQEAHKALERRLQARLQSTAAKLAAVKAERDDLLAACKLARQHLDALRLEAGICNCLTESQRDVFKFVDETLQVAIRKAHTPNPDAREWSDDDCPGA